MQVEDTKKKKKKKKPGLGRRLSRFGKYLGR